MTPSALLAFAAAFLSGALAAAAAFRNRSSSASWFFFAGMATLALESFFAGMGFLTRDAESAASWQSLLLVTRSFLPGFWLAFSLTYSRGNYWEFLVKWRLFLGAAFLLPVGIALGFWSELVQLVPPPIRPRLGLKVRPTGESREHSLPHRRGHGIE